MKYSFSQMVKLHKIKKLEIINTELFLESLSAEIVRLPVMVFYSKVCDTVLYLQHSCSFGSQYE